MLILKATLIGCALASTPFCIAASVQDASVQSKDGQDAPKSGATATESPAPAGQDGARLEALRKQVRELRAALEAADTATREAKDKVGDAQHRIVELQKELGECMDLIEKSTVRRRHRNCTPSRSRSLLTYYQWMHTRGHKQRADRMLARVVEQHGNKNSSLNSLAWQLMTDKAYTGKFDRAALALAERMQKQGRLRHNELDTAALAMFLNGRAADAVKLQTKAIARSNSGEYRRRLRVYQAALRNQVQVAEQPAVAGGE